MQLCDRLEVRARALGRPSRATTNSSALPLCGTIANASTTGLCATSVPRMLNSQQIESGSVRMHGVLAVVLQALLHVGDLVGGRAAGEFQRMRYDRVRGGSGRSLPHAVSTRFVVTGFSLMPLAASASSSRGCRRPCAAMDRSRPPRPWAACPSASRRSCRARCRESRTRRVRLGAHLHGVAAVDEQSRASCA